MDKRVLKTKRDICNAFTELLAQKDLKEITITEIANKAEVNRKTIYNYYSTVGDILNEIEDSIVESYEKVLKDLNVSISLKDPTKIFNTLTQVLSSNLDFYGKLMKIDANSRLATKLIQSLKKNVKTAFLEAKLFSSDDVDFITNYVVSGMIASYQYWFNSGMQMPIEEYSRKVGKLVYSGIDKFIINGR